MARLPSLSAAVTSMAIAVVGGLAPITVAAPAQAAEAPRTASVVGSLQSEAGCEQDWAPDCAATELTRVGDSTEYSREIRVPAGTYEFKVAINKSWDESYGADGVQDGANLPLVLKGPATLKFSYDDVTHKIGVAPTDLPGEATKADRALAGSSLRSPLSSEQMYFLMADRFANGSTANDAGGLTGSRLETGAAEGRRRDDRHLQELGPLRHRRVPVRHRQACGHAVLAEVLTGDPGRGQGRRQLRLLHVR